MYIRLNDALVLASRTERYANDESYRVLSFGPLRLSISTTPGPVDIYDQKHRGSVSFKLSLDGAWRVR